MTSLDFEAVEAFDWSHLPAVAERAEALLRKAAQDKELLTHLVKRARDTPELWSKCEEDIVEDKIVLWDCVEKNLRLRLRMSKAYQEELAHKHRFSFSSLVLHGNYLHRVYDSSVEFNETTALHDIRPVWVHEDGPDDVFTIDHETMHSTPLTAPGTVVLVLRGPAAKERAPVIFREERASTLSAEEQAALLSGGVTGEVEPLSARAGTFFWRTGESKETEDRRRRRQMSEATYVHWCDYLRGLGIIN